MRRGRRSCCARRRVEVYRMITVPAVRLHQFGVFLYQAILGARDVDRLVRFEVLSYDAGAHLPATAKRKPKKAARVNWELLEKRIAASAEAYQRPIIKKKIAELVDYYTQCAETGTLPAVPGGVLLVADRRLEFTPTSSHRVLGVLEIPSEEGVLRALDGQHRLLALHQLIEAGQAEDVQVPAVIFDRLTPDQVVELFVTINAKHTKLNPSHLISLAGRRLYPDKQLAASHDIIRTLNEYTRSPPGDQAVGAPGRRQPLRDRGRVAPEAGRRHARHGRAAGARAAGGAARMRPPHPGFHEPPAPQTPPSRRSVAFVPDEVLLYDLSDSAFCLKARICLQVKGVPFRRVTVTLGRRGELRRLNPLGRVPVLVHGETVIADQSRIAHHLDQGQPEPRPPPIGAEARAYPAPVARSPDGPP